MYILDYLIDDKLTPLRDTLLTLYLSKLNDLNVNITDSRLETITQTISCFVINSFKAYPKSKTFGITLNKNHYSQKNIVNGVDVKRKISYQYTVRFLNFLEMYDYITVHEGKIKEWGFKHGVYQPISFEGGYIEMHPKLLSLYEPYGNIEVDIKKVTVNVVRVRLADKGYTTFRLGEKGAQVKRATIDYNNLGRKHKVTSCVGTHITDIHKVYNCKSFTINGRSYMSTDGIQHLTKEERKTIEIDDIPTVIYDYSAFEPSIAYTLCGEKMPDDPYQIHIDGYDDAVLRAIAKKCLLVMLNIRSKDSTSIRQACNGVISQEFDIAKLHREGKIPSRVDVLKICELLAEKNFPIWKFFYGRSELDIAHFGSLVTDYILDYFLQRDILVLPVFDEFIIQEQYDEELCKTMIEAFEIVLGSSMNCRIKKEK